MRGKNWVQHRYCKERERHSLNYISVLGRQRIANIMRCVEVGDSKDHFFPSATGFCLILRSLFEGCFHQKMHYVCRMKEQK